MKILTTLYQQTFDPEAPKVDPSDFYERHAARAVVLDDEGRVGILHARTHGFHKLPGGGMETGESIAAALERELLEELGCQVEVLQELGQIVEYRDFYKLRQTSYCFLARVKGEKGKPTFTQEELDDGFEIVWAPNISAALSLVDSAKPEDEIGIRFMRARDSAFLTAASRFI